MPQHTECAGSDGIIDFGRGRCTLHATGEELVLSAEAGDQHQLRQLQDASSHAWTKSAAATT